MTVKYHVTSPSLTAFVNAIKRMNGEIPTRSLRNAGNRIATRLMNVLKQPTATWVHKPSMSKKVSSKASGLEITITIDDTPYVILSLGARPHWIRARNAKRLRFDPKTTPKTRPNSLQASAGSKSGEVAFAMQVFHPGITARNFPQLAIDKIKDEAQNIINNEMLKELNRLRLLAS